MEIPTKHMQRLCSKVMQPFIFTVSSSEGLAWQPSYQSLMVEYANLQPVIILYFL